MGCEYSDVVRFDLGRFLQCQMRIGKLKSAEKMIQYMGELMEDATDFSWQGAKAAHAVLLCESTSYTLRFLTYSPDKLFPATRPPIQTPWVKTIPRQPLRAVG